MSDRPILGDLRVVEKVNGLGKRRWFVEKYSYHAVLDRVDWWRESIHFTERGARRSMERRSRRRMASTWEET